MTLQEITSGLGGAYKRWKTEELLKDDYKKRFFAAATEALQDEVASQVVEELVAENEEEALRSAQRKFPRYRVFSAIELEQGKWKVILEEDMSLKEFSYINRETGQVFQRIIAEGTPTLDDDGLAEEQPGLWEAITEEVTVRKLKPLDELTAEQVAALEPYITMPKPQTRLAAPRKAKPEELEHGTYDN